MISRKNKVIYLFILFGTLIRIVMAIIHCTHMDDIGVVNYLIHLLRTTKGDEIDIAKRFSDFWTYGPFQILFTQKLINENIGYSLNIFLGRLPSLICSVLYIFIIFRLLYKTKTDEKNLILLIICLISLSWENIIYSAQMEPYSIGILFSAIIVYFIIHKFYDNWKCSLLVTFLFSIGCYAQYQIFILVFAAYIALFICNLKNKKNLYKIVFVGIVNFVSSIPLLSFLNNSGKLTLGINFWNVGKNGIFAYQNITNGNIIDKIIYTITFFLKNIFICFKYLFLADSFEYIANILTIVLLICACLGLYYIHKKKEYIIFAVFNDLLTVILIVMIAKGSLTMGPSRHILFMEPVWIMLIYFGILQVLNIQRLKIYYSKIITAFICLAVLLFFFSIPKEVSTRKNLISEKYICDLIEKYNPSFVFAEINMNDLYLFNVGGFSNRSEPVKNGWLQSPNINIKPENNDTIILMSKSYTMDDIRNIENSMRKQLEERLNYFNLDMEWGNIDKYKLVYKEEIHTDAEVEYARDYYWNYPNGLFLYVLKYFEN